MLAQNFKSATDLGISDVEQGALINVLGMLERGELVKTDHMKPTIHNGFNMSRISRKTECGTVGCILGWCRFLGGIKLFADNYGCTEAPPRALDLFMFNDDRRHRVTLEQAATALRSYLSTGDANWAEALAVS